MDFLTVFHRHFIKEKILGFLLHLFNQERKIFFQVSSDRCLRDI